MDSKFDTKALTTSNGNKSARVRCWLPNSETRNFYLKFFEHMANEGWKEYTSKQFLSIEINKFANEFVNLNKDFDNEEVQLYTQDDLKQLSDKFKGNALEIIAEGYFRLVTSQKHMLKFKNWSGMNSDDKGIDGYATSLSNDEFLVAIQAKFRSNREVGWQDGIQKAYALVTDEMEEKLRNGEITGNEYLEWIESHRVVLFTSTDASRFLKENSKHWLLVIDQDELFRTLGMYTTSGNKSFWVELYENMK